MKKAYKCPHCGAGVTNDEGLTCPKCDKVYWDDEKGIYPKEVEPESKLNEKYYTIAYTEKGVIKAIYLKKFRV